MTGLAGEDKVRRAAQAARDKHALDVIVLDVQGVSSIADYFLVCSGRSTTHLETITQAVREALRAAEARLRHSEGVAGSGWVLLDYGDVLVHVFLAETRAYYALERLWGDAPILELDRA